MCDWRLDRILSCTAGSSCCTHPERINGIAKSINKFGHDFSDGLADFLEFGRCGFAAKDDEAEVVELGLGVEGIANLLIDESSGTRF